VAWFSVEFIMRLAASPSKCQFVFDLMNVIDLLAIVPYFVVLAVQQTEGNCETAKRSGTFLVIRVLRIFRIFKLSKHSQVWRCGLVFGHSVQFWSSAYDTAGGNNENALVSE